jgi:dynein heavy chain, axonemal
MKKLVARIEACVEEWNPMIASLTEREINKQPKVVTSLHSIFSSSITVIQGNGPMAEIEFWRARNAVYNTLFEQLNNPMLKKMTEVLDAVSLLIRNDLFPPDLIT